MALPRITTTVMETTTLRRKNAGGGVCRTDVTLVGQLLVALSQALIASIRVPIQVLRQCRVVFILHRRLRKRLLLRRARLQNKV